jgi:membrane protein YqaA with SNARE-associated domain
MWWMYLVVFASALAVDLIPIFAPPAWTVMVLLLIKFNLNPWGVLAAGVPGSALGRYLLSLYIPKISTKFIKRRKNKDLEFVGKKLGQKTWRSWLFVFIYTLTPLSSTALFTAAGVAKINPAQIIPPFFLGKFVSDAVMILTGRYAVGNTSGLIRGTFSAKGIVTAIVGLLVIGAFLFIDWRVLLEKRKLKFNFKIWK